MDTFSAAEAVWIERLGNVRNVVRQHVVAHQLAANVATCRTALDVGCGQGTQAMALARLGLTVTGVDRSADLLARAQHDSTREGLDVTWMLGEVDHLDEVLAARRFDLVCAHGLLMYVEDPAAVVQSLASRLNSGGKLSFTVRNGDALAFRPGLRSDWPGALAAFDDDQTYVNELGVTAGAHRLAQVTQWCEKFGLEVLHWYGVRVFTDAAAPDSVEGPDLELRLAVEVKAGHQDPYRRVAAQLHVIAQARI